MKILSISFNNNDIKSKNISEINNPLLKNEKIVENLKLQNKLNLSNKEKSKSKSRNKNNKNFINESTETYNITNNNIPMIQQKILKFNKKNVLSLKKNFNNRNNINLYRNELLENLDLIIRNSFHQMKPKKKKKLFNNMESQVDLPDPNPRSTQNISLSLFSKYKDYQKDFFSSTYNLNANNYKTFYPIYQDKTAAITPENVETSKKIIHFNKNENKLNRNNSCNNFYSKPISNILQRKCHGELPIFLNSPVTFVKNFKSNSEKERDEKNSNALFRLRDFLDIYWDKRIELITEFFSSYQIYGEEYYKNKSLENFANFIYDNINKDTNITKGIIETRIPMKEIIDKGIKYKNYCLRKNKKFKSMPLIKNNKENKKFLKNCLSPIHKIKKDKEDTEEREDKEDKIDQPNTNNYLKKVYFRKSRTIEQNDYNKINCFYKDNYINNDYQLSENEKNNKLILNEKLEKFRKYLNKNYGVKVFNKFIRNYKQDERLHIFSKRKIGTIDIPDKDNLVNNINKQSNFYKLKSTNFSIRNNPSIHSFSEKDFNELYHELKEAKQSYINHRNEISNNKNEEDNIWIKMYENAKKNKFEKHPELILKKKKKLLEYIIFQNLQERKNFEKDLLKK